MWISCLEPGHDHQYEAAVSRPMGAFTTGVVLVLLLIAAVWIFQRRLIYFPAGDVPAPALFGLASAEPVSFPTADGLRLHGWLVPPLEPRAGATILVFNGNAGHRGFRGHLAAALHERGYGVLLFDYRGYGGNPGAPTEAGLAADARAARDFILTRPDAAATRLVYFGESLGTGVAAGLAAEQQPAALVLRSPFTSMTDVGAWHYPWLPVRWLLRDRFDTASRIAGLGCPLLVIAGDQDTIVPYRQSRQLFDAAAGPKRFVTIAGADHNDPALADGPDVIDAIDQFLKSAPLRPIP
jgi:fermentation-respiration switch protein FrsA (DUF1100 family)